MTIAQVARLPIPWSRAGTELASQAGGKTVRTNRWNIGTAAAAAALAAAIATAAGTGQIHFSYAASKPAATASHTTAPYTVANGVIVSANMTQTS
jgi:hypothetical protein